MNRLGTQIYLGNTEINAAGLYLSNNLVSINAFEGTAPAPSPIPTNGLVAWYDASNASSYPGSGTTWTDISPSAGSGTIVGSPSFNSTTKLFTFDGSQRVDLTQIYSEGQQTYTYYAVASAANSGTTQLFGQATEAVNRRALIIRFGGRFGFNGYDNDNNAPAGMSVSNNTLKGISLTMNTQAADQSKAVRFFLNGTLITEGTTFNGPTNLNMGANAKIGANAGNGENFVGDIGVCIAYNRVISDAEMTQINDYYATKYTLV